MSRKLRAPHRRRSGEPLNVFTEHFEVVLHLPNIFGNEFKRVGDALLAVTFNGLEVFSHFPFSIMGCKLLMVGQAGPGVTTDPTLFARVGT